MDKIESPDVDSRELEFKSKVILKRMFKIYIYYYFFVRDITGPFISIFRILMEIGTVIEEQKNTLFIKNFQPWEKNIN